MTTHRAVACVLALAIAASTSAAWAAEKRKPARKSTGPTETLACRLGTEDRHARIAVVVVKGKTDSFAYYSKWKPRTCSIYLQRDRDHLSKWADDGKVTTVSLEKGTFLIEHKPGEYHFEFRGIDRERYCGMDGVINGTLTIKRGNDSCILGGDIMVEGPPLGAVPHYAQQQQAETQQQTAAAESEKPAEIAAREEASAPPPETAVDPAATATAQIEPAVEAVPTAQAAAPAVAEPAQTATVLAQPAPAAPERSADASSPNPLRALFRVLSPSGPDSQTP